MLSKADVKIASEETIEKIEVKKGNKLLNRKFDNDDNQTK